MVRNRRSPSNSPPWPLSRGLVAGRLAGVIYPAVKRGLDVLLSLVFIALLTPVWLLAALAVKCSSPGPIFFVQERGGQHGRRFRLVKYRTMRTDHAHDPTEFVPLAHPGITRIGRMLRRTKVDELPQLFNVLAGQMSLIGPRPTIPEQIEQYDDYQRRRLQVRPGIVGLAQVNGNTAMSWDERIRYDVYYVDHLGLTMDLGILLKTVPVIVLGESRFARPFDQSPYAERKR